MNLSFTRLRGNRRTEIVAVGLDASEYESYSYFALNMRIQRSNSFLTNHQEEESYLLHGARTICGEQIFFLSKVYANGLASMSASIFVIKTDNDEEGQDDNWR